MRLQPELVDAAADGVTVDAEQRARRVVDHRHATVGADRDDALADAVQQRLAVVGQGRDLGRRQPPRRRFTSRETATASRPTPEQRAEAEEEHQVAERRPVSRSHTEG